MSITIKDIGSLILLWSVFNCIIAQGAPQNIEIKNNTSDDLYMALVKETVGEGGSIGLYKGKDNVRLVGKNGLVKAGSSVIIQNFSHSLQGNYNHALWVSKSKEGLQAAIAPSANYDKIMLLIYLGSNSANAQGGRIIPVVGNTIKVNIFKTSDGQYGSDYGGYDYPDARVTEWIG